jgi:hypothetical protein
VRAYTGETSLISTAKAAAIAAKTAALVDITDLLDKLEDALGMVGDTIYTDDSRDNLETALGGLTDARDHIGTQEDVATYTKNLDDAIAGLVLKPQEAVKHYWAICVGVEVLLIIVFLIVIISQKKKIKAAN